MKKVSFIFSFICLLFVGVQAQNLDVEGSVKIQDGTQGNGKVLTSDANGNATWQTPTAGGSSVWSESGTTATYNGNVVIEAGDLSIDNNENLYFKRTDNTNAAFITPANEGLTIGENRGGSTTTLKVGTDGSSIDLTTNGATRMRVNQAGNVGIGTTSPTQKLDVAGTVKATAFVGDGSGLTNLPNNSVWNTSGPTAYYNTGNVGIGTASPGAGLLHLKAPSTGASSGIRMETSLTTNEDWYFYMNATDDYVIRNDAVDYFTIQKNTGNVGIGTGSPTEKLEVNGNILLDRGANTNALTRTLSIAGARNANGSPYSSIDFINLDDDGNNIDYTGARINSYNSDNADKGDLRFQTYDGTSLSDKMIIASDGDIGIGTSTPATKLHTKAGGDNYIMVETGGGNLYKAGIQLRHFNTTCCGWDMISDESDNSFSISRVASADKEFQIKPNGDTQIGNVDGALIHSGGGNNFGSIISDFNASDDGVIFEYIHSSTTESSGFYSDGDFSVIFNPDDTYSLALVDEDNNTIEWWVSSGETFETSDLSLKENVETLDTDVLSKVLSLRGVKYNFKANAEERAKPTYDKRTTMGVIAQEVETVFPELVSVNTQGIRGVHYSGFTPIFIEAIKEQQVQIEELRQEVAQTSELRAKNASLEARLAKLEAAVNALTK